MVDFLVPGFVYSVLKDVFGLLRPKRRKLTPSEIVQARKRWKAEIEPRILRTYREKLRQDVIIRDMKRIDSYPDTDEKKGISPWFRVGLVGTYHRGIQVILAWEELKRHKKGFRLTNYGADERGDLKVALLGLIPFENIDNIDWDGDEYYSYPHIYCFFSYHKEPYEHVAYYTETTPPEPSIPFYTEVATYSSVRRLSKKLGIRK